MNNSECSRRLKFDIEACEPNTPQQLIPSLFIDYLQLILYQRSQIPQPVQLLKRSIKLGSTRDDENKKNTSLQRKSQIYKKNILALLESINNLKCCLTKCFANYKNDIYEMSLFLGATPVTAKEAFSFRIKDNKKGPMAEYDCIELPQKILQFYSKKLCMLLIENDVSTSKPISCSTAHIFIKTSPIFVPLLNMKPWPKFRFPIKQLKVAIHTEFFYRLPPLLNNSSIIHENNLSLINGDTNQIFNENIQQCVRNGCDRAVKIQPQYFTAEEAAEMVGFQSRGNKNTATSLKQFKYSKPIKPCSCFHEKSTEINKKVDEKELANKILQDVLDNSDTNINKPHNNDTKKNENDFLRKIDDVNSDVKMDEFVWYQLHFPFKGFTT